MARASQLRAAGPRLRAVVTGTEAASNTTAPDHVGARRWLGLLVSAVAILGFVAWASRQEKPKLPTSAADLALLGIAVLVYALATLARGWRWHVLLRRSGVEHDAKDAYALVPVGYMGNTILPARGGEVLRVVLLANRTPARKREIGGAIIAERLLDAGVLAILFALLVLLGVGDTPSAELAASLAAAGVVLALVVAGLALRLRAHPRLRDLVERVGPVARASALLLRPVGALLALATAGVWLLEGVVFQLVGRSLGTDLVLLDGMFLVVLASFFALIPAAPAYAGTFDAAIVFGLTAVGVTGGLAVSFAILVRAVLFVPVTIAGLVIVVLRYGGWRALRPTARAQPES
jgi:uncharacterized membrane protein YbhN (UPF0104 family)